LIGTICFALAWAQFAERTLDIVTNSLGFGQKIKISNIALKRSARSMAL
jgi:hypothetical protein